MLPKLSNVYSVVTRWAGCEGSEPKKGSARKVLDNRDFLAAMGVIEINSVHIRI
ncbi:MAG: hypothetical protein ACYSR5_02045 [Planctomycetota bacterium]|jgi:hypothetical protein